MHFFKEAIVKEKRRFRRVDVWASVEMNIDGISYYVDKMFDLSLGGCQFPFPIDLKRGEDCLVIMYLGEGHEGLEIKGKVAWCNGEVVGIAFQEMDYEVLEHIKEELLLNGADAEDVEAEAVLMEKSYGLM